MNKYNWDFTLLDTGFFRSGKHFMLARCIAG